jgi:transposase InsO family protein
MNGKWTPPDIRDEVVDFVKSWNEKTEINACRILQWIGLRKGRFYNWVERYGKVNEHNGQVPRDFWIEDWERDAIIDFHSRHPLNGYRRLCFMMIDEDLVCVSPGTVRNVLKRAGLMDKWNGKVSKKGTGFIQPLRPHEHWHIDVSYLNIGGTFFYLASVLDGFSRFIAHWEIHESMTEGQIELIIERARERFPGCTPRIISDNGPQFIAKDFKEYIRLCGMTHVRTSPFYPQSNGKLERWHGTVKRECIRPSAPSNVDEARRIVEAYIVDYNEVRLHSAIGYVAPKAKLEGRDAEIFKLRDKRLETARGMRKENRRGQRVGSMDLGCSLAPAVPLLPFTREESAAGSVGRVKVGYAADWNEGNLDSSEMAA